MEQSEVTMSKLSGKSGPPIKLYQQTSGVWKGAHLQG